MKRVDQVVFIIDDDASMRTAIKRLVEAMGFNAETFSSAREFLESKLPDVTSCLVLDVRLPGVSGLVLQQEMAERRVNIPIIFVTGYGDIPMSVQAMKAGAVEFLTKPFRDQDLLDAIDLAIERDHAARKEMAETAQLRECYESLTPREQEVMAFVIMGLLNKQTAGELGVSEKTIKVHRSQVMKKMRTDSLADLVRSAERLSIHAPKT